MLPEYGCQVACTDGVQIFPKVIDQDDCLLGSDRGDGFASLQQSGGRGPMAMDGQVTRPAEVECRLQCTENP